MIRILYVESGSGNGGSASCLANLVTGLDRAAITPIVAYYADGVGIRRIREAGIETAALPARGRALALWRLIRRHQVHLVHNNNELYSQPGTMLAAALAGVPCVCTLRATRALTRRERFWVPLVRRFFAVSEATREAYVRTGIPEGRIETALDGIDLDRFHVNGLPWGQTPKGPTSDWGLTPGLELDPASLTVGLVGRLIPEKGIEEFLRAARVIVDRFPRVQFVLVGGDPTPEGRHMAVWQALADQLRLGAHVQFTGWRGDIPALTARFDVAAQASKYWEGWAMSVLEAMACGKPVVATRIGGVPEVVEHGVTGLLVEPGDVAGLADAVVSLLQDPALRRRLGEAGRRRAEERFDQRRLVARMQGAYREILGERPA